MSYKIRKILFVLFILAFLTIAPLISLYAAGYKPGPGFRLEKTGLLSVETDPRGALIYLNDEEQKSLLKKIFFKDDNFIFTPAKIKNLLPGDYSLKIKKEGYRTWERQINIEPGKTFQIKNLLMIANKLPYTIYKQEIENVFYSPDNKAVILSVEGKIVLIDLENYSFQEYEFPDLPTSELENHYLFWSPDSQKFIFKKSLFNKQDLENTQNLTALIGSDARLLKWDPADKNKIYFIKEKNLYSYALDQEELEIIIEERDIIDYLIKSKTIFYLEKEEGSPIIKIISEGQVNRLEIPGLQNAEYEFTNQTSQYLNVYDRANKILYLLNPDNNIRPIKEIINNIYTYHQVSDDFLLYAGEYEIWTANIKDSSKNLITRISRPITGVFWHPKDSHIVYSTKNSINIIEIFKNSYKDVKLIELSKISDLQMSENGKNLYFYGKINEQEGLFNLDLQ